MNSVSFLSTFCLSLFNTSYYLFCISILDTVRKISDVAAYVGTQDRGIFRNVLKLLLRKEVIQPHLPIRLPCYDFTPIINPTFDCCLPKVSSQASGVIDSHGVTGGVYKARERIHRGMLIRDY